MGLIIDRMPGSFSIVASPRFSFGAVKTELLGVRILRKCEISFAHFGIIAKIHRFEDDFRMVIAQRATVTTASGHRFPLSTQEQITLITKYNTD